MAVAYTALVSLISTLDNIHNYPRFSTSFDKEQIKSLGDNLDFFLEFVENYISYGDISKEYVEAMERQIASAAHAAEDLVESHIADHLLAEYSALYSSETDGSSCSSMMFDTKKEALKAVEMNNLSRVKLHLQKILEEMEPIKEKVREVKKAGRTRKDHQLESSISEASSLRYPTTRKTSMVGFDTYLHQLLDWLTGHQSDRKIISITGMGGIGKTTLARSAYENLLTVQYFDVRAWVTISQEYNATRIIVEILSCIGASHENKVEYELGERLYKTLAGMRYLIILDDMWSIEAWEKVKCFFPDHRNRSRIIVTTRISSVASYFGSMSLALDLLDADHSWNLFCESVFGKEVVCPPELEVTGKNIVKKCSGLPLSVVLIAGLLRKSPSSLKYWEYVARDLNSILNLSCFDVVFLSYNHLPVCVRPCFLYLGAFREDEKISISRLIRLWVSEGFVKPDKVQSLEQVAEGYIEDLVDRNLILNLVAKYDGTLESCMLHDIVRDFCVEVAQKERAFRVVRELNPVMMERRNVLVGSRVCDGEPALLTRSIICYHDSELQTSVRLLRVMQKVYACSKVTYQQFNLRFIWLYPMSGRRFLPSSISLFWNLQTLYIRSYVVAPSEIWEMRQLRHIVSFGITIPNPPVGGTILCNLQTLKKVYNFSFSEEACKRMPNLKDLEITHLDWRSHDHCHYNLFRLDKVETLYYYHPRTGRVWDHLARNLSFPLSLKELCLGQCKIHCDDLTVVGSLPNLEVLKLVEDAIVGPEWNTVEGEFLSLKFLEISKCYDLIHWNAENSHFPVLEKLVLYECKLNEIPQGIGVIPTLKSISMRGVNSSVAISAARLLEERRESLGDDGLQVRIDIYSLKKYDEFKEMVAEEVLKSLNLQLLTPAEFHF